MNCNDARCVADKKAPSLWKRRSLLFKCGLVYYSLTMGAQTTNLATDLAAFSALDLEV